jgi:hypothetical protein
MDYPGKKAETNPKNASGTVVTLRFKNGKQRIAVAQRAEALGLPVNQYLVRLVEKDMAHAEDATRILYGVDKVVEGPQPSIPNGPSTIGDLNFE